MVGVRLFLLVALGSCGGSVLIEPKGTCSLGGSEWSCKTALTDASRVLPGCPNDIAPGGSPRSAAAALTTSSLCAGPPRATTVPAAVWIVISTFSRPRSQPLGDCDSGRRSKHDGDRSPEVHVVRVASGDDFSQATGTRERQSG